MTLKLYHHIFWRVSPCGEEAAAWFSWMAPLLFTVRKQLTSQKELSSLYCLWGNHNTSLAEMLGHRSQHSCMRAVPHSCRSTDKWLRILLTCLSVPFTSEDVFVHNPDWKRRRTATWHRCPCDERVHSPLLGVSELYRGLPPVTGDMALDWQVTRRRMQLELEPSEKLWEPVNTWQKSGVTKPGCVRSMQVSALKYVFTSQLHSWQNAEQDVSNNWQRSVHYIRQCEERAASLFTQHCKTTSLPANKWAILNNS